MVKIRIYVYGKTMITLNKRLACALRITTSFLSWLWRDDEGSQTQDRKRQSHFLQTVLDHCVLCLLKKSVRMEAPNKKNHK